MKSFSDVSARAQDAWSNTWSETEARVRDWVSRDAARKSIEGEIERMLGPIVEARISEAIRGYVPQVTITHSIGQMAQESWGRSAPRVQKQFPVEHVGIAMSIVLIDLGYDVDGDTVKIEIDLTGAPVPAEFIEEEGALSLGAEDDEEAPEGDDEKKATAPEGDPAPATP